MVVRPNGCGGEFSECSVGHRFSRKVYIDLASIPIVYNHCYLHLQNLNLANFWYFLKWFDCSVAMMDCVVVNKSDYCYSNRMWIVAAMSVTFCWHQSWNSFAVDFELAAENPP